MGSVIKESDREFLSLLQDCCNIHEDDVNEAAKLIKRCFKIIENVESVAAGAPPEFRKLLVDALDVE